MLNQLVEFGKKIRKPGESDALKEEHMGIDVVIDSSGAFEKFIPYKKEPTRAEALKSKKGKARLLLDKAEEVLGFDKKKHALFLSKLEEYQDLASLKPVLLFYGENKKAGLEQAAAAFKSTIPEKTQRENLAFLILGESSRVHEKDDVRAAIIAKFEADQETKQKSTKKRCSVCGTATHPILNEPHGMIKGVPSGQSFGSTLVSYNEKAFESYGLNRNENSSICSACARNYVEGLNYLLGNGVLSQTEKGKEYFQYSNRKKLATDTALVYWTKSNEPIPELELLENAKEQQLDIFSLIKKGGKDTPAHNDDLTLLLNSPQRGVTTTLESVDADRFYACILSGAAARIAIRTWVDTTAPAIKRNIATWFSESAIAENNFASKKMEIRFFSLRELASACAIHLKKEQEGSTRYVEDTADSFTGRAATILWNCALLGKIPPLTLLDRVMRRIKTEGGRVTAARGALIKFILNLRTRGEKRMHTHLDEENSNTAYLAGRIFAMLENIQSAALGQDLNAPISSRFFSAAVTNPAATFGRLCRLSQHHLAKLRNEKWGLAKKLDKELGEVFCRINKFPPIFSLEEQGQFAIGYYHQKQAKFTSTVDTKIDETSTTTDKGE